MNQKSPHGRDLRKGRQSLSGQIYLVTTVTKDRQPFFANLLHGRIVVSALRYPVERGSAISYAFVIMPDHLHWLVELCGSTDLSRLVGSVKSYSSQRINQVTGRGPGSIWQRGFHDHALRSDEDLKTSARYIVYNPVRAGIVGSVREYSLWDAVWL